MGDRGAARGAWFGEGGRGAWCLKGRGCPWGAYNWPVVRLLSVMHIPAHRSAPASPSSPTGAPRIWFRAGFLSNKGREAARGVALLRASGALDASQTQHRPPVCTSFTKAPARRNGQGLARRTACLIPGGGLTTEGERLPVGWRINRPAGHGSPATYSLGLPAGTSFNTAPARWGGQARARCTARLIPGGELERRRVRGCPRRLVQQSAIASTSRAGVCGVCGAGGCGRARTGT